jgi:hypothetical protein
MATPRSSSAPVTDPSTLPDWVLSFHAAEPHWLSLIDPSHEPVDVGPVHHRPWRWWAAERTFREVRAAWLAEHAPDLNIYDLWDEARRRAGRQPIYRRASALLRACISDEKKR